MFMPKHLFLTVLVTYFGCEIFSPLGTYPKWMIVVVFISALVLFVDNLLTWWKYVHAKSPRG